MAEKPQPRITDEMSENIIRTAEELAFSVGADNVNVRTILRALGITNRVFYNKLQKAKMKQSMSRVAKCIDNGPMEGFWGILKRERYYGRRFTSREELVSMIENYITYYNNRRVQRNLGVLTPMEKHYSYPLAA